VTLCWDDDDDDDVDADMISSGRLGGLAGNSTKDDRGGILDINLVRLPCGGSIFFTLGCTFVHPEPSDLGTERNTDRLDPKKRLPQK